VIPTLLLVWSGSAVALPIPVVVRRKDLSVERPALEALGERLHSPD
jgi:hypothetical protein